MSNALAIQPIDLYEVARTRQVQFQSLLSAMSANDVSPVDSASSIVHLSALGQVIGAGASLQSSLDALQANTAAATPNSVQATAQAFVAAFNTTQQSLAAALSLVWTLPDETLVSQFAQTLNASGTSSTTAGILNLSDLQAIGISFLPATPLETTARLSIDQNVLNAAATASPAATATLLAEATQSLLQQVTVFEAEVTRLTSVLTDTAVLGSGVATAWVQNLSADALLNAISLNNTELAAVELAVTAGQPTGQPTASALALSQAARAALADTPITTLQTAVADVTPVAVSSRAVAADTAVTPDLAARESSVTLAATTVTATDYASQPQPSAATTTGTLAAVQTAAEATTALQTMMTDSAWRDVIFNPAYSAFIATAHMSDFIEPIARMRTGVIPAEIPGAVLPINRIGASSSNQQTTHSFVGRE